MKNFIFIYGSLFLFLAGCSTSTKVEDLSIKQQALETRVIYLENNQSSVSEQKSDSKSTEDFQRISQALEGRINLIERDIRRLKEDNENLANSNDNNQIKINELERTVELLNKQIKKQELDLKIALSQIKEQKKQTEKTIVNTPVEQADTEEGTYAQAENSYNSNNYIAALSQFNRYLSSYPDGQKRDLALFYIGNIHFSQGQFKESSISLLELTSNHKESSKYVEGLWLFAVSLDRLGNKNEAIRQYEKISSDTSNPYKQRADLRLKALR